MKFICEKAPLVSALSRVQGAILEKNLAYIGINASDDGVIVTASDRVISIYSHISCKVEKNGIVFIPAKLFSDLAKELPSGSATFMVDQAWLFISAGVLDNFSMKIPLLQDIEWVPPPFNEQLSQTTIPSKKLAYMIEQVQFCVSPDSQRNYGAVAFLHNVSPAVLRLVGTDGYRLSYCDVEQTHANNVFKHGVCITKRGLIELLKMCHENHENIELQLFHEIKTLAAKVDGYSIYILISSVKYPDYQGVIPKSHPFTLTVNKSDMHATVKRVLLAADKTKALQLNFDNNVLTLSSKNMGKSESREDIQINNYNGPAARFAVNGSYLSDVLSTSDSDQINIQFKDDEDPVMLIPGRESHEFNSRHVLVPIREFQNK